MSVIYFPSQNRARTWLGWLRSYHAFSFGHYYNPELTNFGSLLVLNDDEIAPGSGFDRHPHKDMEIVTMVLSGKLEHQDSTGTSGIIEPGEVQIMSAGTGIYHSEKNASKDEYLTLLQIWILPNQKNLEPRYAQKKFDMAKNLNSWQHLVSPDEREGSLKIFQEAYLARATLGPDNQIEYVLQNRENLAYVFVIDGEVSVFNQSLLKRDALGISGEDKFVLRASSRSDMLVLEVPDVK
jgi:quercetin 2,3-dioxygenase